MGIERSMLKAGRLRSWLWTTFGLAVGAACVIVLLHRVEPGKFMQAWSSLDPSGLFWLAIFSLGSATIRPWRWHRLYPEDFRPRLRDCFSALFAGNLINLVVPARGGDAARCLYMGRLDSEGGAGAALAALSLEKIFDGLALVVALLLVTVLAKPAAWVTAVGVLSGLIFISALAVLLALKANKERVIRLTLFCTGKLHLPGPGARLCVLLERFARALAVLHSPRQIAVAVLLTACVWLFDFAGTWALAAGMGISLPFAGAAAVSAFIGLAFMLPASPGNVGTYEAAGVSALAVFGIAVDQGLPLVIALHLCTVLLTALLGVSAMVLASTLFLRRREEPCVQNWSRVSPVLSGKPDA